ncbi:MAG: DUF3833 family protein [Hyphomicrobiales bacterium]
MKALSKLVFGILLTISPVFLGSAMAADTTLVLEKFFVGNLSAKGEFTNIWSGNKRGLTVEMKGRWNGSVLELVEDFVYSDGEKDKKTWIFTKLGDGVYSGLREDVTTPANVRQDGDAITFSYTARIKTSDGGGMDLSFYDRLEMIDAKTVRNTADVYWLGFIKVGEVELIITRAK